MAKNTLLVATLDEAEQLMNSAELIAGGATFTLIPLDAEGSKVLVHTREATTANPESDDAYYQAFRGND